MRFRMKSGQKPVVMGVVRVPEHPEYFEPPEQYRAAFEHLSQPGGPVEKAPYAAAGGPRRAPTGAQPRPPAEVRRRLILWAGPLTLFVWSLGMLYMGFMMG